MMEQKFPIPEVLTHPNIPKPLHGLAPRVVKGDVWWDRQRQKAYRTFGWRCWACGRLGSEDPYSQWLEAHEFYDIDYEKARMTLKDVVALCHSCHSFIHSGRLWSLYQKKEISYTKIASILDHGFLILVEHNLKPFWGTLYVAAMLGGLDDHEALKYTAEMVPDQLNKKTEYDTKWEDWRLIVDGEAFGPAFNSFEEWQKQYG